MTPTASHESTALVLTADGPAVRLGHAFVPQAGEATVRLRLGGICATDLELIRGYMGFEGVLGHEWVGVVEASPDPTWVGRRVVGEINCPCGACPSCRSGRPTHCPTRTVLGIAGRGGAFASRFSLPVANLHEVPEGVADAAAVFVEPLAAALEILEQIHVRPSERVVVLGAGRLGQLCARVLALAGARVAVVSRNAARLTLLPVGIERRTLASLDNEGPLFGGLDASSAADIVVDATGSADGLALATRLVRPRGTIVLKTTVHDAGALAPTPWVIDEIRLVGSRCGPFAPALRLLASGAIDPRPLISARYALKDGVAALAAAGSVEHVKVLLEA